MKIHLDGTVEEAMALWMVTMTIGQMGALEDEDPLAMTEVGAVPTVVTGEEALLISQCKMQVWECALKYQIAALAVVLL